jgi:hypothetical protein
VLTLKFILCLSTLALFAGSIHAATITSEARCYAAGNSDIGTTSCRATGFYTGPNQAWVGAQLTSGASSVSYQISGNHLQWEQRANGGATGALSLIQLVTSLSVVLQSDGPSRPGFVTGPFLIQHRGTEYGVFFPGYANRLEYGWGAGAPPIPITLGELFPFVSTIRINFSNDVGQDASIAGMIQFFEADGVTPVAITDATAPEPGSFLLFGLGGAALLARRTRVRSKDC